MTEGHLPVEMPTSQDLLEHLAVALPTDGSQVELSAVWQQLDLTRFSGGRVHQNVQDWAVKVWARAWTTGGAGFAVASTTDASELRTLVEQAVANANNVNGTRIQLPGSAELANNPYFDATAALDISARSGLVREILEVCKGSSEAHGNIRVACQSHAIANTAGLRTGYEATYAAMNLVAQASGRATGYAGAIGRDSTQLDFIGAAAKASEMASQGQRPIVVEPGQYEILIDPPAVSMLLVSLGYVGLNLFGANAAGQDSSWHHLSRKSASEEVTLTDDPLDPMALFSPIDAEGTPRSPLTLIDEGTVVGAAHDITSATTNETSSTGHAMPPGDKGPAPHSLNIPAGTTSREEIISRMKRGLIVNRIHPFVSLRSGPKGELSGTTRDGVFLVEHGEIVGPAANVRWSNSMQDLLGSVEARSSERSVEFMDLPEFSPHTSHVPSLYSTHFTVQSSQPRER